MRKIQETLRQHYELKRSNREIGRSLHISAGTVSKVWFAWTAVYACKATDTKAIISRLETNPFGAS